MSKQASDVDVDVNMWMDIHSCDVESPSVFQMFLLVAVVRLLLVPVS